MRDQYLKAMGITRWRLRKGLKPLRAERELLAAIQQALGSQQDKWSIIFGEYAGTQNAIVIPYTLAEILQKPLLKAEVWEILKKAVEKL